VSRPPLFPVVFGVTFCFCLLLAAPGLTWLDGGELALAAGSMGVAHPPGEPAWLVFAKLASLVPIGDLPFRLTVLSAVTVASAAGLLALVVAEAAGRMTRMPGAWVPVAGLISGLSFGLAPALVLQGVRPELYGLTIALGILSVRALQMGGRRGVALAVLPLAVAGAVHHAMLVAAIPGLVLLATGRGRGSIRTALLFAVLIVLPALGQFAWLPLRSMAHPPVDFGSPRTFDRVVHAVTAAGYTRSFHLQPGQLSANLWAHARIALIDLGPVALLLAALAARPAWRSKKRWALGALLLIAVGVLPTALQGLFREDNPDARGYLLGPIAVLAAGAGLGAADLLTRVRGRWPAVAPWLGAALVLAVLTHGLTTSLRTADHRGRTLPAEVGAALLDGAAPGSLVLLAGDSWAFPPLYLRYWEGRRPDLHVGVMHLLDRTALESMQARGVPVPSASEFRGAPTNRQLIPEWILAGILRASPDLPIEVNEVWLPDLIRRRRKPAGLLHRLHGPPTPPTVAEALEDRLWSETLEPAARSTGFPADTFGHGVLERRYAARAGFHRMAGHHDLAGTLYGRGSALQPNASALIQLMRWRWDEGMERQPYPPEAARALADAETLMAAGRFAEASHQVRSVLSRHPIHPEGLLCAARLYSLGHAAAAPGAAGPESSP